MAESTSDIQGDESKVSHDGAFRPFIIGIGASAGGLEALQEFFEHVPAPNDLSFVVVQHLSPDYKSMMAELLAKCTAMKVPPATLPPSCRRIGGRPLHC